MNVDYDKLTEGSFDHSSFIEDSILTYMDIIIDEDLEAEEDLLSGDSLLEMIDILDDEIQNTY